MLNRHLQKYLKSKKVEYETISHPPAFTAQEVAAQAHIPGRQLAKTVMVKLDGKLAMVVEPAHRKVNLQAVQDATGAKQVELAKEYEFKDHFPDCEAGALPPIDDMVDFDIDVYVDEHLANDDIIAFSGGTHSDLVKIKFKDYKKLVKPKIIKMHTH